MRKSNVLIIVLFCLFFSVNHRLSAQKDKCLLVSLNEHADQVHSVAFSPDGKQFITGSKDEKIMLWDFATCKVINEIKRHYASIYELEYSNDGNFFFSGGDKTINVWNSDGTYLKSLSGHTTSVWSVGLSKDAEYLVSGSFDNNFRIWSVSQGKTIHVFENNKKSILAVAYSKANNLIACGAQDGSIEIYTFDDFQLIHTFFGHGSNIYSLDFSNDGRYLASASRDNTIKIWDLEKMEIFHVLSKHERSVMSVKFSKDDRYLISGSYDASVILWDAKMGEAIYTFLGHRLPVNDADISSDNKYILSASSDNTVKVWELKPEVFIEFYFNDEYQREIDNSKLFDPKQANESRTEFKERQLRAEEFKVKLIQKYMDKINNEN